MSRRNPATSPKDFAAAASSRRENRASPASARMAMPVRMSGVALCGGSVSAIIRRSAYLVSSMDAFPLEIVENGRADAYSRKTGRRRSVEPVADPVAPASYQGQGDRTSAIGTPVTGGDMSEHAHRDCLMSVHHDLGALVEHLIGVVRQQSDELLAAGADNVGAGERALADEVRFRLGDQS